MDAALLYEAPYTYYDSNGLNDVFTDNEVVKILEILSEIRRNAA